MVVVVVYGSGYPTKYKYKVCDLSSHGVILGFAGTSFFSLGSPPKVHYTVAWLVAKPLSEE